VRRDVRKAFGLEAGCCRRQGLAVALAAGLLTLTSPSGAEERKSYDTYESCRKAVVIPRPPTTGTTSWLTYSSARGAGRFTQYGLWIYCHDGYLFAHYTPTYSCNTVGTVLALPLGDFAEMESYDVNVKDKTGKPKKGLTKKIAVNVHISYPSATKPPPEFACQRMVENLVTSGMNIPNTMGKPCRLMPLRQTAMLRYGAKRCYPDYSMSAQGTVILLLEDCDPKRAKPYIVPAIAVGKAGSARTVAEDGVRLEERKNEINDGYTADELRDLIIAHRHKLAF